MSVHDVLGSLNPRQSSLEGSLVHAFGFDDVVTDAVLATEFASELEGLGEGTVTGAFTL